MDNLKTQNKKFPFVHEVFPFLFPFMNKIKLQEKFCEENQSNKFWIKKEINKA